MAVTLAEGNNSMQMYMLTMPFYMYTLFVVVMAWIGALLWWKGDSWAPSTLS